MLKLYKNNNREWFNANKAEYLVAQGRFNEIVAELIDGISSFDDTIRGLTPKDCTYRIYRDTRFSKDKVPYKTHMGAYICRGGRKSPYAGYYFHVEPSGAGLLGGNLITSGIYMPQGPVLRSIREDICYNGEAFLETVRLAEPQGFAFSREEMLKRVPLGFPTDSPYAEYLKLKNVYLEKSFDNAYLLEKNLAGRLVAAFETTYPFIEQVNRAVEYAEQEMM